MLTNGYKPKSPLEALSIQRFGGRTFGVETLVQVFGVRTRILANNPNRLAWSVINEGTVDARISTDANMTSASGWLLMGNGGVISMAEFDDGETVGYELFGASGAGNPTVRVREVLRE